MAQTAPETGTKVNDRRSEDSAGETGERKDSLATRRRSLTEASRGIIG